jgi:hypothetical protein
MIGRVWTKDMICYGLSDAFLEAGMMFWRVQGSMVVRVAGRPAYGQYGGVEYLERVRAYELTDVQRRRIYCWRRSCRKGKMRDNQP